MLEGDAQFLGSGVVAMPGGEQRALPLPDGRDQVSALASASPAASWTDERGSSTNIAWISFHRARGLVLELSASCAEAAAGSADGVNPGGGPGTALASASGSVVAVPRPAPGCWDTAWAGGAGSRGDDTGRIHVQCWWRVLVIVRNHRLIGSCLGQ